jgi:glycosyltransferase involved in cell wall biosynthesis
LAREYQLASTYLWIILRDDYVRRAKKKRLGTAIRIYKAQFMSVVDPKTENYDGDALGIPGGPDAPLTDAGADPTGNLTDFLPIGFSDIASCENGPGLEEGSGRGSEQVSALNSPDTVAGSSGNNFNIAEMTAEENSISAQIDAEPSRKYERRQCENISVEPAPSTSLGNGKATEGREHENLASSQLHGCTYGYPANRGTSSISISGATSGTQYLTPVLRSQRRMEKNDCPGFREGTILLTDRGEVPIECLSVGDVLMNASMQPMTIRWIGSRNVSLSEICNEANLIPILISQRALDDAAPNRDLWLSPSQGVFLDNCLVPASALVNDTSIRWDKTLGQVRYYCVELDSHSLIVANGAMSESFVDDDNRHHFENSDSPSAVLRHIEVAPCYRLPWIDQGEFVERIRERLSLRADGQATPTMRAVLGPWRGNLDLVARDRIEGWAIDDEEPDRHVRLRLFDNGVPLGEVVANLYRKDLEEAGIGQGFHGFLMEIPGGLNPSLRHFIEVVRSDDFRVLQGAPRTLDAFAPSERLVVQTPAPAHWRGQLETVTRERIEGWVWDENFPKRPLALTVLDNGEVIGRLIANRFRADLLNAGIGSGRHGFIFNIPGGLSPLSRHIIRIIGDTDGLEMPTSPVVIEAVSGFDAALMGAVRSAVYSLSPNDDSDLVLSFLAEQVASLLQQKADAEVGIEARTIYREWLRRWGSSNSPDTRDDRLQSIWKELRPRALVVDEWLPEVDKDAGATAILSHIRALVLLGYDVYFAASEHFNTPRQVSRRIEIEGATLCKAPYYSSVEEVLIRQRNSFDIIYLHRISSAAKYLSLARACSPQAKVVYSVADLHHVRLARQAKIEARSDRLVESEGVRIAECYAASAADVVLTHSPIEAKWLKKTIEGVNVHVVPWTVPVRRTITPWVERSGIAFIGNFAFAPNVDAAHYLVREIMPVVWATDPSIECMLVGSRMQHDILGLHIDKVQVLGQIPDLSVIYERVRLTVAPLRFGAGIKGKVLESLAAGVPCVMSQIAAEGLDQYPGIVVDQPDPEAFARGILKAYSGGAEIEASVSEGVRFVTEYYQEEAVLAGLRAAIQCGGSRAQSELAGH